MTTELGPAIFDVPVNTWYGFPFNPITLVGLGDRFGPRPISPELAALGVKYPFHFGLDMGTFQGEGTPIYCPADGFVETVLSGTGFGNLIRIEHEDGSSTAFAHLQFAPFFALGATVKHGDCIGLMGATGQATGPHLHLERRRPGYNKQWWDGADCVDPLGSEGGFSATLPSVPLGAVPLWTGELPAPDGLGMLVARAPASGMQMALALRARGVIVESLFTLALGGIWSAYIPGAPDPVNAGFAGIAAGQAFVLKRRA